MQTWGSIQAGAPGTTVGRCCTGAPGVRCLQRPTLRKAHLAAELAPPFARIPRKRAPTAPSTVLAMDRGVDDSMTFPWKLGGGAPRSALRAMRTVLVALVAVVGSWSFDRALGERGPTLLAAHAAIAGLVAGVLAVRRRRHARVAWDATHDPLTGLLNRRGLVARGEPMRRALAAAGELLAVVYVDLDDFKKHNDRHGHAVGDRLLVSVARALSSTRATDLVARLGGDELVLLVPRATEERVHALLGRARERFERDACELGVAATFSAGIHVAPASEPLEAILEDGDHAMYEEKRRRKAALRGEAPAAHPLTGARRARRWVYFASALVVGSLGTLPASAQDVMTDRAALLVDKPLPPPPPPPADVRVELIGGTLAPIDFELGARIVAFDRIVLGVAAGVSTYGGVAGQLVDENGGGGAGSIVATLVNGAYALRAYVGIRPFEGLGLELTGGYALLDRTTTRVDVGGIARTLGAQTTATVGEAQLVLHTVTAELAWTFFVLDHLVIRPSIGWIQVLSSEVTLTAPDTSVGVGDAATALEQALGTYGMGPTLSIEMGYRF